MREEESVLPFTCRVGGTSGSSDERRVFGRIIEWFREAKRVGADDEKGFEGR